MAKRGEVGGSGDRSLIETLEVVECMAERGLERIVEKGTHILTLDHSWDCRHPNLAAKDFGR
jgi:hypothetical protein